MDEKHLNEIMEGYWYHNELIRLNILKSAPLMTTKDLSRKIDDSWAGLSKEQQNVFILRAKLAKKTINAPILPPRLPLDPFVLFVSDRVVSDIRLQTTHLSMDKDEIIKELICEWKQMTTEERAPFLQIAEIDKEQYDKDVDSYLNCFKTIQHSTTTTTTNNALDKLCGHQVMDNLDHPIITNHSADSPERIFVKQEPDYVYGLTNNSPETTNIKKETNYEYGSTNTPIIGNYSFNSENNNNPLDDNELNSLSTDHQFSEISTKNSSLCYYQGY
ncbi:6188_t:CDS:2 [Ambispora leptoticha]|uniref:6188_t:CDS:1 n=1 Tax=Ambispora leptoticha TaxID=144679 RepID=A0A9N9AZ49_9GLOM|nr:6188_t:CDS:2 [Ambispora leptoticha]